MAASALGRGLRSPFASRPRQRRARCTPESTLQAPRHAGLRVDGERAHRLQVTGSDLFLVRRGAPLRHGHGAGGASNILLDALRSAGGAAGNAFVSAALRLRCAAPACHACRQACSKSLFSSRSSECCALYSRIVSGWLRGCRRYAT